MNTCRPEPEPWWLLCPALLCRVRASAGPVNASTTTVYDSPTIIEIMFFIDIPFFRRCSELPAGKQHEGAVPLALHHLPAEPEHRAPERIVGHGRDAAQVILVAAQRFQ